jgi:hypothetical protein
MISFAEFAARLEASLATVRPRLEIGLAKTGTLAHTLAAEYIGNEMPEWPPLAESTIADKESKGFAVPAPLLRTGEMRDSIQVEVDPVELEMVVGSNELVALWQEMGTDRGIPPRPFLATGLKNSLEYAEDVFGEAAVSLLTGTK